jgi:diacylglycerol kinase family enzyme
MAKIGIIINPHSKKIKKLNIDPVEYYKNIGGNSVYIRLTSTLDDIVKAAKDFKKQRISFLAISGGDGSVHHVISRFINEYKNTRLPDVLILKDGSTNIISKTCQLKGKGPALLKKLINAINNNTKINILFKNTLKINDMYCFSFGAGFPANVISEYNKGGNKGLLKEIKVLFMSVINAIFKKGHKGLFSRIKMKIIADGKELQLTDFFAILAATYEMPFLTFKITSRAYEKDDAFHLIATGMKPFELVLRINKLRTGKPIKHKQHCDDVVSELKLVCKNKFLYQMDGDIYESDGKLTVTMGPRIGFVSI